MSSDTRQMSSDMQSESVQLTTELNGHQQHHDRYQYCHRQHRHHRGTTLADDIGDDECSTDSSCSSDYSQDLYNRARCYPEQRLQERLTRSQEQLNISVQRSSECTWSSPENVRSLAPRDVSLSSYSSVSPSDEYSGSDSDSVRTSSTAKTLRRAFQSLKILSSKWDSNKEKRHPKKSPKRILRSPVLYLYVRGPSGLPTQRIPRQGFQQQMIRRRSYQEL